MKNHPSFKRKLEENEMKTKKRISQNKAWDISQVE